MGWWEDGGLGLQQGDGVVLGHTTSPVPIDGSCLSFTVTSTLLQLLESHKLHEATTLMFSFKHEFSS